MAFSDKDLEYMREFLKNEDVYVLMSLKGKLLKKMKQEGKTKEEGFKKIEELGNDIKKYHKFLSL